MTIAQTSQDNSFPPRVGILPRISLEFFGQFDLRVATVHKYQINTKARKPAALIEADFGNEHLNKALKRSSAQVLDLYLPDSDSSLLGKQIVAVTNFAPVSVGVKSYFLTLGAVPTTGYPENGIAILTTLKPICSGLPLNILGKRGLHFPAEAARKPLLDRMSWDAVDLRVGQVKMDDNSATIFFNGGLKHKVVGSYEFLKDGMQILRLMNLDGEFALDDNLLVAVDSDGKSVVPISIERPVRPGRYVL